MFARINSQLTGSTRVETTTTRSATGASTKAPAKSLPKRTNTRQAAKTISGSGNSSAAPKPAADKPAEKLRYAATARCGKTNSRLSNTPLTHAVDVRVPDSKNPQYAAGVICGFYASKEKAQAAADQINREHPVWAWGKTSDAIVVAATLVT